MRRWVATKLRFAADRVDPTSGPRASGFTMSFVEGEGVVFEEHGGGAPLWHMEEEYDRAFIDYDVPVDARPGRRRWRVGHLRGPS